MLMLGRVQGHSMYPLLRPGDFVLAVALAPGQKPRIGDIVWLEKYDTEARPWGVEIHRVVRLEGTRVVTQGDANGAEDPAPGPHDVLAGRVVARRPAAGADWWAPRPGVGWLLTTVRGWRSVRWRRAVQYSLGFWAWKKIPGTIRGGGTRTMTISQPNAARLHDPIEVQQLGDEYAVYDDRTGAVHILNSTAGLIFSLVRSGLDTEGVLKHLHARFPSLNTATLRSDIAVTLAELRAQKLID